MSRRGALAAGALIAASSFFARAASAAQPTYDTSAKDFSLSTFDGDDSLSRVQKAGELVIGTSNDWPYSFLHAQSGELDGIDADILKVIARTLKARLRVETVPFDGLVPGLLSGRFDMVGDSIHFTPKRAKAVGFSYPTYFYAEALVVKKGSGTRATTLADLSGKSVGTLLGTSYADWIQENPNLTFNGYKDAETLIQDLSSGRLDAGLYDRPVMAALIGKDPSQELEIVETYHPRTEKNPANYSCYLFRQQDQQLNEGVSRVIQWMQYSGDMKKVAEKWNLGPAAL